MALFWSGQGRANQDPARALGWNRLAQVIESTIVPGTHLSMITEHIDVLAQKIEACLDRVQGSTGSASAGAEALLDQANGWRWQSNQRRCELPAGSARQSN
jgi:hypothetical protein